MVVPDAAHSDNISIHALREEGDAEGVTREYFVHIISIHAPREEGDSHKSRFGTKKK